MFVPKRVGNSCVSRTKLEPQLHRLASSQQRKLRLRLPLQRQARAVDALRRRSSAELSRIASQRLALQLVSRNLHHLIDLCLSLACLDKSESMCENGCD